MFARIFSLVLFLISLGSALAETPTDSICSLDTIRHIPTISSPDTIASHNNSILQAKDTVSNRNWWYLARHKMLDLKDTTVQYPKFIGFCVKVYNWADKTFNSYDPEYVEGTGKRWKARIASDNWTDSYAIRFADKGSMRMMSDLVANFGAYIQYMAVSIGYSFNLNHLLTGAPISHNKMEFGFNCARFNIDFSYTENTGGSYLRKLSTYKDNNIFKSFIPGIDLYTINLDIYYFLNNKKYSQGAAYNFSKLQKKSAGSFIVGFSYSNQDISMDFSTLEDSLKPYYDKMGLSSYFYKFHYNNYCLLLGYGHNFVLNSHFLYNITAMPSVGINHCYEDSADGSGDLFSLNVKGKMSLTYNVKNFFAGLQLKADGHWYHSDTSSLFNPILYANLAAGFRF